MPAPRPTLQLTSATMVLVFVLGVLLTLIEIDALEYTWEELGIPHRWFFGLLVACLFGSMINLPLMSLPGADGDQRVIIAVNVGGALVPTGLAIYLITRTPDIAGPMLLATAVVTAVSYRVARPLKGVGITMPIFVAPLVAAAGAFLLAPASPAPIAYIGGTLGTLIGADLLNLRSIRMLGAPIVSIGGAGTFDGVFLSGLLAVLLC
ncbi:MAG: DUF1614 domain-containing protein [Deltaproteobacteria bacterium]